jgi:hypothetical protein
MKLKISGLNTELTIGDKESHAKDQEPSPLCI